MSYIPPLPLAILPLSIVQCSLEGKGGFIFGLHSATLLGGSSGQSVVSDSVIVSIAYSDKMYGWQMWLGIFLDLIEYMPFEIHFQSSAPKMRSAATELSQARASI